MQILNWRSVPSGAMLGVVDVRLESGLILHETVIMRGKDGTVWAAPPSKPMVDRNGCAMLDAMGKRRYSPIVSFVDAKTRARFSNAVVEALRLSHPEALAEPKPAPDDCRRPITAGLSASIRRRTISPPNSASWLGKSREPPAAERI